MARWIAATLPSSTILLLFSVLAAPCGAEQGRSLMGSEVQLSVLTYSAPGHPLYSNGPYRARVTHGVEFTAYGNRQRGSETIPVSVDIGPDYVAFDYSSAYPGQFTATRFNGYTLKFSNHRPPIVAAALNVAATSRDLQPAVVTFSADEIRVNVSGLRYSPGSRIALDVAFTSAQASPPSRPPTMAALRPPSLEEAVWHGYIECRTGSRRRPLAPRYGAVLIIHHGDKAWLELSEKPTSYNKRLYSELLEMHGSMQGHQFVFQQTTEDVERTRHRGAGVRARLTGALSPDGRRFSGQWQDPLRHFASCPRFTFSRAPSRLEFGEAYQTLDRNLETHCGATFFGWAKYVFPTDNKLDERRTRNWLIEALADDLFTFHFGLAYDVLTTEQRDALRQDVEDCLRFVPKYGPYPRSNIYHERQAALLRQMFSDETHLRFGYGALSGWPARIRAGEAPSSR